MIKYKLLDTGIFYVEFTSIVTLGDIKFYLNEFEKIAELQQNLLILYDFQRVNLQIKPDNILEISELAEKVTRTCQTVRTAFVATNPDITAFSILFERYKSVETTQRKVFYTVEAAMEWLKF